LYFSCKKKSMSIGQARKEGRSGGKRCRNKIAMVENYSLVSQKAPIHFLRKRLGVLRNGGVMSFGSEFLTASPPMSFFQGRSVEVVLGGGRENRGERYDKKIYSQEETYPHESPLFKGGNQPPSKSKTRGRKIVRGMLRFTRAA